MIPLSGAASCGCALTLDTPSREARALTRTRRAHRCLSRLSWRGLAKGIGGAACASPFGGQQCWSARRA